MKSLSDVVGGAGLHRYAEVALVIFFIVFVAVVIRALAMRRRDVDHIARLPLEDDTEISARSSRTRGGETE